MLLDAVDDRLESRAAEAVHGERGRRDREARFQPDVARAVDRVRARLHHVADDDVADRVCRDLRLSERGLRRDDGEVGRGDVLEGALHGAERGAFGADDDDVLGELHGGAHSSADLRPFLRTGKPRVVGRAAAVDVDRDALAANEERAARRDALRERAHLPLVRERRVDGSRRAVGHVERTRQRSRASKVARPRARNRLGRDASGALANRLGRRGCDRARIGVGRGVWHVGRVDGGRQRQRDYCGRRRRRRRTAQDVVHEIVHRPVAKPCSTSRPPGTMLYYAVEGGCDGESRVRRGRRQRTLQRRLLARRHARHERLLLGHVLVGRRVRRDGVHVPRGFPALRQHARHVRGGRKLPCRQRLTARRALLAERRAGMRAAGLVLPHAERRLSDGLRLRQFLLLRMDAVAVAVNVHRRVPRRLEVSGIAVDLRSGKRQKGRRPHGGLLVSIDAHSARIEHAQGVPTRVGEQQQKIGPGDFNRRVHAPREVRSDRRRRVSSVDRPRLRLAFEP